MADVELAGTDPVLPSMLRVGECAAAALGAQAAAIAEIWRRKSGERQRITATTEAAALATFSANYVKQNGYPVPRTEPSYPLTDFYRAKDDWIFLHGAFPRLRNGLLDLLGCSMEQASIAGAVSTWAAADLEDVLADAGLCGAVARRRDQWLQHPQGRALAASPLVELIKIGTAPPVPFQPGARPLSGLKVLDLTHVIAGPTCTKSLAEQGATVLHLRRPDLPTISPFDVDTGHGKLSAFLDLDRPTDHATLTRLTRDADVFAQSFRPGKLAHRGFSPEVLALRRPGIIYLSVNCHGWTGPWRHRAGWEQLAQAATGMARAQGILGRPLVQPCFPNDYITGFLGALGVLMALLRRSEEGGSWHVRVSLSRTAMWIQEHGLIQRPYFPLGARRLSTHLMKTPTVLGEITHLAPALRYERTPAYWERPTRPLGVDRPDWPVAD